MCVVNPAKCTLMVCAVAVADISASVSTVDSVVKLKDSTMLAGFKCSASAICRCAPVSRQMPCSVASVIAAQLGSAALMLA